MRKTLISIVSIILMSSYSCKNQSNVDKSDFDFLIGEWEMYNSLDGTETKMIWSDDGEGFSAILETKSDKYVGYNYKTEYKIYKENGKWYWYSDHTSKTNKPSYHYELRKLLKEEYAIAPKPGYLTFIGTAKDDKNTTFQLHWDNSKLLVKYSMLANGYLFEKI